MSNETIRIEPSSRSRRRRRRRSRQAAPRNPFVRQLLRWLDDERLEKLLFAFLLCLSLGSTLLIGGIHAATLPFIVLLSSVVLAAAFLLRFENETLPLGWPVVILWLLAAYCLVQAIPLPLNWLERISPVAADIWRRSVIPLNVPPPAFGSISLDPGASVREAFRFFSYGAAFAGAATLSSRRGVSASVLVVFAVALVAGMATFGHGLLGMRKVFGLYTPGFNAQPWHIGPLLNPNNLAGMANLGVLCGLGLALQSSGNQPRWAYALGSAILVATTISTSSRAGVAALALGAVCFLVLLRQTRKRRAQSSADVARSAWVLFAVLGFGGAMALLGSSDSTWRELFDKDIGKLSMVSWLKPVVRDFGVTGLGRGSFESVFPAYQLDRGNLVFTHTENFVAQWIVEWGIVPAIVALFALAWHFRPKKLGVGRRTVATGAWVGAATFLLQNIVDLGTEIPALAIALAIVLGAVWGDQHRVTIPSRLAGPRSKEHAARWAYVALAVGLVSSCSLVVWASNDLRTDRRTVRLQFEAATAPRSMAQKLFVRKSIAEAVGRHPAEPYFPMLGALLAWQERDQDPIPWLQRTLERSRANGRAHLLLAMVLQRRGALRQSLMELRLAIDNDETIVGRAAGRAVAWTDDIDELRLVVPRGRREARAWASLGRLHKIRIVGKACDARALAVDSSLVGPRERLANDLIEQRKTLVACTGADEARCERAIVSHAEAISIKRPRSSAGAILRARWLDASDRTGAGEFFLRSKCDSVDDRLRCLRQRTELAAKLKEGAPLAAASRSLLAASCVDHGKCAAANTRLGDLHMRRTEYAQAVAMYSRAVREQETWSRLLKLATAGQKAGLFAQALRALERAKRVRPHAASEIAAQTKRLRELMIGNVLGR
jgi:tetratricopeptide (TPR) repeat protein